MNEGKLIGFDTIDNLEIIFKTKELVCEIEYPIPEGEINGLLLKLEPQLLPFIEKDQDSYQDQKVINYDSENTRFLIKYDGTIRSKREILEILSQKFSEVFKITSFYEPRVSQLEKIYSKMINKNNYKRGEE